MSRIIFLFHTIIEISLGVESNEGRCMEMDLR